MKKHTMIVIKKDHSWKKYEYVSVKKENLWFFDE
jgi:hypothetical protein